MCIFVPLYSTSPLWQHGEHHLFVSKVSDTCYWIDLTLHTCFGYNILYSLCELVNVISERWWHSTLSVEQTASFSHIDFDWALRFVCWDPCRQSFHLIWLFCHCSLAFRKIMSKLYVHKLTHFLPYCQSPLLKF